MNRRNFKRSIVSLIIGFGTMSCSSSPQGQTDTKKPLSFEEFIQSESKSRLISKDDHDTQQNENCDKTCVSRRAELRYLAYVGKEIYCYWDLKKQETGVDFEAFAKSLEQKISSDMTPSQYYRLLRTWAAVFHDGHVNVLPGDMSNLEIYSMGVKFEVLAAGTNHETVIVSDAKDAPNVTKGDEVLKIDGLTSSEYLNLMESERSGSTRAMRRYFSGPRISSPVGSDLVSDALSLDLKKANGTLVTAKVPRTIQVVASPNSASSGEPPETTGAENFKVSILPGSLGYLRIDGFSGSQSEFLLDQALNYLASTKGLLIDVRANGGGDQSGNRLIRRLITKDVIRYSVSERMSPFVLQSRPSYFVTTTWSPGQLFAEWHDLKVSPTTDSKEQYLNKPTVVLTGNNCFSACDTFVSALKSNHLATIVGENTGGGTGTPLVFDMPVTSTYKFRYSVVQGKTAINTPIEGVGTAPDLLIERTLSERQTGSDQQLATAVKVLMDKINPSNQNNAIAQTASSQVMAQFKPSWISDAFDNDFIKEIKMLSHAFKVDEQGP